jgi:riboflavin kinase/FMN adenylyltransferase
MKIITAKENLPSELSQAILVIGNFDGVHKGHQALIAHAKEIADARGLPLGALTFEPHPRALLRPDDPPFRITPMAAKMRRIAAQNVDFTVSLPFNWDFASLSPASFIETVLNDFIKPSHIVVGNDFAFGQMRKGSATDLIAAGYEVTTLEKIEDEGQSEFSSSRIREALHKGDIEAANAMLGWEWEIEGPVVKGDQRGREIGFPTANIPLGEALHPAYGIYATMVQIEGEDTWRPAATNIGIRPMFELKIGQIEAHLMDYEGDLYGKILRVKPIKWLRGEAKFESLEALIEQIGKDCEQARAVLKEVSAR